MCTKDRFRCRYCVAISGDLWSGGRI